MGYGWLAVRRLCVRQTSPISANLQSRVNTLCETMRINQAVRVLESGLAATPMVVGWIRPIVLLPATTVTGLTPQQLQAVIAHELAHVLRNDYLVNLVQCLIETLLFYHPAVWWIGRVIRAERERCCDDIAVSVSGDRVGYARALLRIAETAPPYHGRMSLASQGGDFSNRVHRLLNRKPHSSSNRNAAGFWAIVTALTLAVAFAMSAVAQEQKSDDPGQMIDDLFAGKPTPQQNIVVHMPTYIDIPYDKLLAGDPTYNIVIRPNDMIKILGPSPNGFVYLQGEAKRPGAYSFPGPNTLTLKQLIASAGGFPTVGPPLFAKIIRRLGPNQETTLHFSIDDVYAGWAQDAFLTHNDLVVLSTEPEFEDEPAKQRRLLRESLPELKSKLSALEAPLSTSTYEYGDNHRIVVRLREQAEALRTQQAEIMDQLTPEKAQTRMAIIPAPEDRLKGRPPKPEDLVVLPLPNAAGPKETVHVTLRSYGEHAEETSFARQLDHEGVLHLPGIDPIPSVGRSIAELEDEVLTRIRSIDAYKNMDFVKVTFPEKWLFVPDYPPQQTSGGPSIRFHILQADFRLNDALRLMRTYGDVPDNTRLIKVIRQSPTASSP